MVMLLHLVLGDCTKIGVISEHKQPNTVVGVIVEYDLLMDAVSVISV